MYTAHTSARRFKHKRLRSQVPIYFGSYLQPISLQLEAGPEPHPEDANGPVTQAGGSWQGNATPPGTQLQTFAIIKIDFGTCCFFVPLNCLSHRLFHRLYVRSKKTPRRAKFAVPSLNLRSRVSKART